jgi:outer membrane protein assembly factor BamA
MTWLPGVLVLAVCTAAAAGTPQDTTAPQPQPILRELRLEGTTVFTRDDVLWLLKLREGSPLPDTPAAVAKSLAEGYDRDGFSEARVTAEFTGEPAGRLTLTVDEGRIDDIEIAGVSTREAARYRTILGIKPGDIYNRRAIERATTHLIDTSRGAFAIGQPRRGQPGDASPESAPDKVILDRRGARNILVVPLRWRSTRSDLTTGSGREDLFSPADGFAPAIGYSATIFDHSHFNHTFVDGYVSYKFGRDDPGFSAGFERPIFRGPARLFLGAEAHDVTTSDDLWRITSFEQTLVSVGFKNSFRDYYRRKGAQVFTVLRAGEHNEFSAMARWDRHEPLENATSYSFFRDDASFRPALPVQDRRVNAFVLGYTFDTGPLSGAGNRATYQRHVKDSLYSSTRTRRPGVRIEWTSEIAGRALKGDSTFERHILNARGHVPLSSRMLVSARGMFGFSNGTLPVERLFAVGGIGSVHGYGFKESGGGTGMTLLNAEYAVSLSDGPVRGRGVSVFAFYDAGRVTTPLGRDEKWLRGVGFGVGSGSLRLEFGFRASDIPESRQILLRFAPTF